MSITPIVIVTATPIDETDNTANLENLKTASEELDSNKAETTEVDLENSKRLASLPASKQLDGNIALSNVVSTLIYDGVTYTGNGTSQDIVTGINSTDFNDMYNGAGQVLGTQKVTNGDFTTDTSNWSGNTATLSVDTQRLKITSTGANGNAEQNIAITVGKTYVCIADFTYGGTVDGQISAYDGVVDNTSDTLSASGKLTVTFIAQGTNLRLRAKNTGGADTNYNFFDNISVREITTHGYHLERADNGFAVVNDGAVEEVANGTFDTDTDWVKNAAWTISGGVAVSDGIINDYIYQNILLANKTYSVEFDIVTRTAGTLVVNWYNGAFQTEASYTTTGHKKVIFSTDADSNGIFYIGTSGDGFTGTIDNVSVKEVTVEGSANFQDYDATSGETPRGVCRTHVKKRSDIGSHGVIDGLRGREHPIFTNDTWAEGTEYDMISSFNSNGITVGTDLKVNENAYTYISYQDHFCTHIKWGTTNHGKKYVEAYNPVTNECIIMYDGSGTAGHEIPQSVGVALDFWSIKALYAVNSWETNDNSKGFLLLDDSVARDTTDFRTSSTSNALVLTSIGSRVNGADEYILYGKAKSKTWTIVPYVGSTDLIRVIETLDVDGVARQPARVTFKATSAVGSWGVTDNTRGDFRIVLDDSIIEVGADDIDYKHNGFVIKHNGAIINADGVEYIALVEFDTDYNGGGSKDDLPSSTTQFQITDGQLIFSKGYIGNHALNSGEEFVGGNTISPTWVNGAVNYVKRVKGTSWVATARKPIFGRVDGFADFYMNGKWYEKYNLVDNGDFVDGTTTGWIGASGAVIYNDNSRLKISEESAGVDGYANSDQVMNTVVGQVYRLQWDFEIGTNTGFSITAGHSGTSTAYQARVTNAYTADGSYEFIFTATDTILVLAFIVNDASTYGFVDNIQVTPIELPVDATEYTTEITYLDGGVEVDPVGNLVEYRASELVVPDVSVNKITTNVIEATEYAWANDGVSYIDEDAIGANPVATVYPDGTIVGSTDNGSYTKYPNGEIEILLSYLYENTPIDTARGSLFMSGTLSGSSLPIQLVSKKSLQLSNDINNTVYWVVTANNNDELNNFPDCYAFRALSNASIDVVVSYTIKGRYK